MLLRIIVFTLALSMVWVEPAEANFYGVLDTSTAHTGVNDEGTIRYYTPEEASHLDWQWRSAPDSIKQSIQDATKIDSVVESWSPTRGDAINRFNVFHPSLIGYVSSHGGNDYLRFPGNLPLTPSDDSLLYASNITNGMNRYGYSSTGGARPVMWLGACSALQRGSNSDLWKALNSKGFASVVGFASNVPTLDEPRLARYFFYYGTRHVQPKRSVQAAYQATVSWRFNNRYNLDVFDQPYYTYIADFVAIGHTTSAYFNW